MRQKTRVFIISETPLLNGNLTRPISNMSEVDVVGEEVDLNYALPKIRALKPNVIIWGDSGLYGDQLPEIMDLLTSLPSLKVIHLNVQSQKIQIYQVQRLAFRTPQDLIRLLKGGYPEQNDFDIEAE